MNVYIFIDCESFLCQDLYYTIILEQCSDFLYLIPVVLLPQQKKTCTAVNDYVLLLVLYALVVWPSDFIYCLNFGDTVGFTSVIKWHGSNLILSSRKICTYQ